MDEKKQSESNQSKKPDDTDFKQQRLPAWQPLLTPNWVIAAFLAICAVFLPIGIVIVAYSDKVVEIRQRYDQLCPHSTTAPCSVQLTLDITQDMNRPIYFYYELSNFFQNHRRYVKSRSDPQLQGSPHSGISGCSPLESNGNATLYPCGLIANSFFNDSFAATTCTGTKGSGSCTVLKGINWSNDSIAWSTDVDYKFKSISNYLGLTTTAQDGHPLPSVVNADFIVWMRTAGLPNFKKLHRIISNVDLKAGTSIVLNITDNYSVRSFDGEKRVVLSTTSFLGGKNTFLGWAYIGVAIACFVAAAGFAAKHRFAPRRLGDMQYFHWSMPPAKMMDDE